MLHELRITDVGERRYHRRTGAILLLTCVGLGVMGFAVVQMELLEAPRGLGTLLAAGAAFGWAGGWVAQRRAICSTIVSAGMAIVTTLVTAGLCVAQGNTPPSFWFLMAVLLAATFASGMIRLRVEME